MSPVRKHTPESDCVTVVHTQRAIQKHSDVAAGDSVTGDDKQFLKAFLMVGVLALEFDVLLCLSVCSLSLVGSCLHAEAGLQGGRDDTFHGPRSCRKSSQ